jgi:hypothetical protein
MRFPRLICHGVWTCCCFTSGIEGAADTFRPSQCSLLPIEPLPQVGDANAVCRAEPRCWKLSGIQSFADLVVAGSNENGSLFDGYCDRSSNGDLEDMVHLSFMILATNISHPDVLRRNVV